jgi:hypothetical protein
VRLLAFIVFLSATVSHAQGLRGRGCGLGTDCTFNSLTLLSTNGAINIPTFGKIYFDDAQTRYLWFDNSSLNASSFDFFSAQALYALGTEGADAIRIITNGGRLHLGQGTNDYLYSDGTNIFTPSVFRALRLESSAANGSDGLKFITNGARLHLGTGTTDYLYSNGANIIAPGDFIVNGSIRLDSRVGIDNYFTNDYVGSPVLMTDDDGLSLNGSTPITHHYLGTATLDFGSIAASSASTLTATISGALSGDWVGVTADCALTSTTFVSKARVTATDTVSITLYNGNPGGADDPPSCSFIINVERKASMVFLRGPASTSPASQKALSKRKPKK